MTFLEQLQAHKGGLIRMKTQLYWYTKSAWDGNPGRVCILLDAMEIVLGPTSIVAAATATADTPTETAGTAVAACSADARRRRLLHPDAVFAGDPSCLVGAHLLIDGQAHWVWVTEGSTEVINESR